MPPGHACHAVPSPKWVFVVRALVTVFLTQIRVGLRFCPLYVADSKPQSRVKWPGRGAGNFVLSTLLSVLKCYFLSGSRRVVVSTQKTKFRRNLKEVHTVVLGRKRRTKPTRGVLTAMDGPSVVARVIPWKMVLRNTGVGTQLQPVSRDTSLFERRPPGRLR
jgi:hypothetical protein